MNSNDEKEMMWLAEAMAMCDALLKEDMTLAENMGESIQVVMQPMKPEPVKMTEDGCMIIQFPGE